MKTFYRVSNTHTEQGLWYDFKGNFTGLIHNEFDFCLNRDLKMDYDPELVGWLSCAESLDDLYRWFTKEDILRLQEKGYAIHTYESDQFKFYERFQHLVINQSQSKLSNIITL